MCSCFRLCVNHHEHGLVRHLYPFVDTLYRQNRELQMHILHCNRLYLQMVEKSKNLIGGNVMVMARGLSGATLARAGVLNFLMGETFLNWLFAYNGACHSHRKKSRTWRKTNYYRDDGTSMGGVTGRDLGTASTMTFRVLRDYIFFWFACFLNI